MEDIIIPQSIADYQYEQLVQQARQESAEQVAKRKLMERKAMQKQRAALVKKFLKERVTYQQLQNAPVTDPLYNQQVVQQFETDYNQLVSDTRQQFAQQGIQFNSDDEMLQFEDSVNDAIETIDDDRYVTIQDLDIKQFQRGDIRVNAGIDNLPFVMQNLISITRKLSNSNVTGRLLDVRQIAKVNHLLGVDKVDGSKYLSPLTVSFRPKNDNNIKRSDRIMISVPGDYDTTGDLRLYMQHENNRFVCDVKHDRFSSNDDYMLFLSNAVNDFFELGFDNIHDRVITETNDVQGLDRVMQTILATGKYNVRKLGDANDSLAITPVAMHQGMMLSNVFINRGSLDGTYTVILTNDSDPSFYKQPLNDTIVTIDLLQNNIVRLLDNWFARNWNEDLNAREKEDTAILNKFVIVKMRKAVMDIIQHKNNDPYFGIVLDRAYSREQTAEFMPNKQMAEVLIGKTKNLDYFILTCSRDVTSGKMMFLLEYACSNVDGTAFGEDFEQILNDTNFLFDNPVLS